MKSYRVFKTISYWVDVEVEDDQTDIDAMDAAMEIGFEDWESEVTDDGAVLDGEEDGV
jgi:hypothetical protein